MTALLWIDFESTALTPDATYLECAWAITDIDGTQRTPVSYRYCAFGGSAALEVPQARSANGAPVWSRGSGDEVAMGMAVESGLFDGWLASAPASRLTSGAQLERLLLDDIAVGAHAGCWDDEPSEYVHIAGAGAARYDFGVLAAHCPGVVPVPGQRFPTHYRPVDTSIAQTALLGNNAEDKVIAWGINAYGENIAKIELGMRPQYSYTDNAWSWVALGANKHRAVPDICRAIVVQRILWRYAAPLRRDISLGPVS